MAITPQLLDALLQDYQSSDGLLGPEGLLQQLTIALVERALQGELTHHLGYEKHASEGNNTGNSRNGTSTKTIQGKRGPVQIEVPRNRNSDFEPQLIKKGQNRFDGVDDKIISLYARGMTIREIQGHLQEIYGIEVSPGLISTVTHVVLEEVRAWQNRPLEAIYPILYLDALHLKVKSQGHVINKAFYLAFGVNLRGCKEVLGLWTADNEGAKFWLQIITELKNRGVGDIYIACVDGLRGFAEAIETLYPQTQVQLCLVHLARYSLNYVSPKDRKEVATDLTAIYQAPILSEAERELGGFEEKWNTTHPVIGRSWRANWAKVAPMCGYPAEIRRAIYTTNAIESLNMTLRKISKNRALFPSDEAVFKLLYLALRNISQRWTMPIANWGSALNQFAIFFEGRVPLAGLEVSRNQPFTQ
jgi:putative transposase